MYTAEAAVDNLLLLLHSPTLDMVEMPIANMMAHSVQSRLKNIAGPNGSCQLIMTAIGESSVAHLLSRKHGRLFGSR